MRERIKVLLPYDITALEYQSHCKPNLLFNPNCLFSLFLKKLWINFYKR